MRRLILASIVCAACLRGQSLEEVVKAQIRNAPGKVTLFAKNLDSGVSYNVMGNEPVRTASTIKLAIMTECFAEAAEGKLKLSEPVEVTEEEKVSGSGILQEFSTGDKLPLRDVIDLMIVLSDNTATNLILNRIGGNAVNSRMVALGLVQTRSMRKILGDGNKLKSTPSGVTEEGGKPENKAWGIGRSSPQEMVVLLEKMHRGELVSKTASEEMLSILKHQRDRNGIGRDMKDVEIASKSGALEHLRSDVGIVYSKGGPIAMAVTVDGISEVNWSADNPGLLTISRLSEALVSGLASKQ